MASYESVSRDVDVDEHHTYTQVQIILQTNRQQVSDKQQYVEYEKVSDQGPVWVQSEDKVPGGLILTQDINIW